MHVFYEFQLFDMAPDCHRFVRFSERSRLSGIYSQHLGAYLQPWGHDHCETLPDKEGALLQQGRSFLLVDGRRELSERGETGLFKEVPGRRLYSIRHRKGRQPISMYEWVRRQDLPQSHVGDVGREADEGDAD